MLKYVLLISALFLLFKPIMPVLEYAVNYHYIATVLCVNKDKPQSECNGKCHLKKALKDTFEEDNTTQPNKVKIQTEDLVVYLEEVLKINFSSRDFYLSNIRAEVDNNFYHLQAVCRIFRPPKFSSFS